MIEEQNGNGGTRAAIQVQAVELRHIGERQERVERAVEALTAAVHGWRADTLGRDVKCGIHSEKIDGLERAVRSHGEAIDAQQKEGRWIGALATSLAGLAAMLGVGGKP